MINTGPYIENNCGMPLKLVANYDLGREREPWFQSCPREPWEH